MTEITCVKKILKLRQKPTREIFLRFVHEILNGAWKCGAYNGTMMKILSSGCVIAWYVRRTGDYAENLILFLSDLCIMNDHIVYKEQNPFEMQRFEKKFR